eukprot:9482030-Pyramimonas_sp.AAC.1
MGRTTAEVYVQCDKKVSQILGLGEVASMFRRMHVWFCTDGDKAIGKAARVVRHQETSAKHFSFHTQYVTCIGNAIIVKRVLASVVPQSLVSDKLCCHSHLGIT